MENNQLEDPLPLVEKGKYLDNDKPKFMLIKSDADFS